MDIDFLVILIGSYVIGIAGMWFLRHKITLWIAQSTYEFIVNEVTSKENQEALAQNINNLVLEPMRLKIFNTIASSSASVSKNLKRMEGNLIAGGIDEVTGIEGAGDMITPYLKKYPYLKALLPILMRGKNPQGQSSLP